jgi:hypothetical protein
VMEAMRTKMMSIGGDIKFLRLKQRGVDGLVCDGGIRDMHTVKDYGPLFWGYDKTANLGTRIGTPYATNDVVSVDNVLVRPGDYILADDDGPRLRLFSPPLAGLPPQPVAASSHSQRRSAHSLRLRHARTRPRCSGRRGGHPTLRGSQDRRARARIRRPRCVAAPSAPSAPSPPPAPTPAPFIVPPRSTLGLPLPVPLPVPVPVPGAGAAPGPPAACWPAAWLGGAVPLNTPCLAADTSDRGVDSAAAGRSQYLAHHPAL